MTVGHRALVSVIIPVHNACAFLRKSVESILAEDCLLDVIVVDDGSDDGSLETVEDLPVRCFRKKHGGVADARNFGLSKAKGNYIHFFDSDDLCISGSLKIRVEWLQNHPNEVAVGGTVGEVIDEEGRVVELYSIALKRWFEVPERLTLEYLEKINKFPTSLWLYVFRKDFVKQVGSFDTFYSVCDDTDFIIRALHTHSIPILHVPSLLHRVRAESLSKYLVNGHCVFKRRSCAEEWLIRSYYGLPCARI
ncbi:MAG: glycosyltransferase [Deltaproteobacteria bacterium]|nr:glycosyltransferase [Deltaproteobacteria bacterium]